MKRARVVHFTNNDCDGAGLAVVRLHRALLELGVDSLMVVLNKTQGDRAIHSLNDGIRTSASALLHPGALVPSVIRKLFRILPRKLFRKVLRYSHIRRNSLFNVQFPSVPYKKILSFVNRGDVIVLHSIQDMMTPKTILRIYRESRTEIIFHLLDMEPLTGGCHFNNRCRRYESTCGWCPQLRFSGPKDISQRNIRKKLHLIGKLPHHLVVVNRFSCGLARKSTLFSHSKIHTIPLGLEKPKIENLDQASARDVFRLPHSDKIILFGCFNFDDPRKGAKLLQQALNSDVLRRFTANNKVHLLSFGNNRSRRLTDNPAMKWTHLGLVNSASELNAVYRAADVLASPSLDDLGPTIAVEGFCNELPIVSFNLGVAQDLVIDGANGFLIDCFNVERFAEGIVKCLTGGLRSDANDMRKVKALRNRCSSATEAESFLTIINEIRKPLQ